MGLGKIAVGAMLGSNGRTVVNAARAVAGAASTIGASRQASSDSQAISPYAIPGTGPGQVTQEKTSGTNVNERFAAANGAGGGQTTATATMAGAGMSNKPFMPLDSSKLGLEGISKALSGLGTMLQKAWEALTAKKDGKEGGGQESKMSGSGRQDGMGDDE